MIQTYIAVDLETTGLNAKLDKIIEIGAWKIIEGQVKEHFQTFVNPHRLLEEKIRELTGISDEVLTDAPEIGEVIGMVVEFCGDLPVLGHHVMFDYSFLKRAAVNAGLRFDREGIDTLSICRAVMPPEEKKNLEFACAWYGIRQQESHRALEDARSAHELYQALGEQYAAARPELFLSKPLIYKVKKEQPASKIQKQHLRDLLKYHKIDVPVQMDFDYLSRNEISRITDKIISQYGRI